MYEAVVCRFCGGSVPAAPPAHPVQSAVVGLRDEKEWAIGTDETGAPQLIKVAKSFVTIRSTVDIRKPARKWTTEPIRDLLAVTFDETTNQLVIESRSRTFTFRADDPAEGRKLSRQINLIRVTGNP